MSPARWFALAVGCAAAAAILIQVPQALHFADPRSNGIPVHLNADEYVYLARVEESLSGRPAQSAEAFVGDSSLQGTQPALLERAIGVVFRPTGLRAAAVLQIMDSIVVFFLFLVVFGFFRTCGFHGGAALTGTLLLCAIEFNTLNRPVHPAPSVLLVFLTLLCIAQGAKGRPALSVLGGLLLGILFGDYFWSWTFAWAWVGIDVFWEFLEWWRTGSSNAKKRMMFLALSMGIGAIATLPFFIPFLGMFHHPSYAEAAFRSGLHPSRLPESLPYSVLFLAMTGGTLATLWTHYERLRPYRMGIVTLLTGFTVMHQELLHGIVFNFVSHYLLSLAIAALCCLLLAWTVRTRALLVAGLAAAVYLSALAYDGRWVLKQFTVQPSDFQEQHFATLLPVLDALPRQTILSDPESLAFVAGATKHDIVYSVYLKNILMPHTAIAERFCLTQIPVPPNQRNIEKREWLIYPDAVSAFPGEPWVKEKELEMIRNACLDVESHPAEFLRTYRVSYILWDEEKHPEWNLKALGVPLEKTATGSGWSLWSIKR
jgi:hypothetical protein